MEGKESWREKALAESDSLRNVVTSIDPLSRVREFARMYQPGREKVKGELTHEMILQLIMQHLEFYGFRTSCDSISKEGKVQFSSEERLAESRLLYFLREAVKEIEEIFDLSLDKGENVDHELEELLCRLELIEGEFENEETQNVNIWSEPAGPDNIVYEDKAGQKTIKAASLNQSVEVLTSASEFDNLFVQTFLMTYQSFCTPKKLLQKLLERFEIPVDRLDEKEAAIVEMRVGNVLKKWIDLYWDDFDLEMIKEVEHLVIQLKSKENKSLQALSASLSKAIEKQKGAASETKLRQFKELAPPPKVNFRTIFSPKLSLFDVDEEEVARQLCLIEFDIYSRIRAPELLNQNWSKPKYKHKSPNVLKLVSRFNQVSGWVAGSILQVVKVRNRAKLMAKFIKLAEDLRKLNNFNGCMAILAALNFSSVHRLKWTKKELPIRTTQVWQELEKTMSNEGSFKAYREALSSANPPCIPYLGVYLTDLTFIDENPNEVNGLINFTKRRMVYNVIAKVQQYQQVYYNLLKVDQISRLLHRLPVLDEQSLYQLSLKREPRKAERNEIE